ncbi:MAG: 30S ribosomal protein S2 [Anaerohalosphaeraceae bacterium]|nr:30S ribosomal protein S2 [Anaerohalosphaeraceae bacterium]
MANELARNLINAGVHFGHAASRWNPKMKPYIHTKRGMVHIIDIKETLKGIVVAKKFLADIVASGKDVVFVGTKRQAQKAVREAAEQTGMHYVINRWLGGTLTNFSTINSRIKRLEELEAMAESGKIEAESKKRAATLKRELNKIKANLNGIRKMNRVPGAIVVVDAKKEHLAIYEARKMGVPTIAIIDTDSNPDSVDLAIPANDDSIKGVALIIGELVSAVTYGKTMVQFAGKGDDAGKPAKARRRSLARANDDAKAAVSAPAAEAVAEAVEKTPETPAAPAEPKQDEPAKD